jgi:hypothetical protein
VTNQQPRCETCRFWDVIDPAKPEISDGFCRRNAPAAVRDAQTEEVWGEWPKTYLIDWCGEWQEEAVAQSATLSSTELAKRPLAERAEALRKGADALTPQPDTRSPDREWLCGILAGLRLLKDVDVTLDDKTCRVMLRARPDIHETFPLSELVYVADDKVVDKIEAIVKKLKSFRATFTSRAGPLVLDPYLDSMLAP